MEPLTLEQIETAIFEAMANARELLEEARLLRADERCARAYFLAHIACEEVAKLPTLTSAAVRLQLGDEPDWNRIDRTLRSHRAKIRAFLLMDSVHGTGDDAERAAAFEEDLERIPTYNSIKNVSLYTSQIGDEGDLIRPSAAITCEVADSLLALAESRVNAFEAMYVRIIEDAGGLAKLLVPERLARIREQVEQVASDEAILEEIEETGRSDLLRRRLDEIVGGTAGDGNGLETGHGD